MSLTPKWPKHGQRPGLIVDGIASYQTRKVRKLDDVNVTKRLQPGSFGLPQVLVISPHLMYQTNCKITGSIAG